MAGRKELEILLHPPWNPFIKQSASVRKEKRILIPLLNAFHNDADIQHYHKSNRNKKRRKNFISNWPKKDTIALSDIIIGSDEVYMRCTRTKSV